MYEDVQEPMMEATANLGANNNNNNNNSTTTTTTNNSTTPNSSALPNPWGGPANTNNNNNMGMGMGGFPPMGNKQ